MCQTHTLSFADCQALGSLPYFEQAADGQHRLVPELTYSLVDFHTHLGWNYLLARPVDLQRTVPLQYFFHQSGVPINLNQYASRDYTPEGAQFARQESFRPVYSSQGIVASHTIPNILAEMDRMQVSHSVILAIDLLLGSRTSEQLLEHLQYHPRLVTFISIHPFKGNKRQRLKRFKAQGAKGMKIHPPVQLVRVNHPQVVKLCRLAAEFELPVLFHSGASDVAPWQARYSALDDFDLLLKQTPDTTVILGHGGIHEYRKAIALADKYPNVYIELSGQPPVHIQEMIQALGPDRLLFGSDWPWYPIMFPLAKVLLATEGHPLAREKILGGNARQLLGL